MTKGDFIKGEKRIDKLLKWPEISWMTFKHSPVLRMSVIKTMLSTALIFTVVSGAVFIRIDRELYKDLLLWTIPAIFIYTLVILSNLRFVCDNKGQRKKYFKAANILTSVRIISVVPMFVFFFRGYLYVALVLYFLAAFTDIADGYIARRYSQETRMGLMLDPIGDILSTESVYLFLLIESEIPLWLFILLTFRYFEFFTGLILLYYFDKRPVLRATITGKIVGVIQFLGVVILVFQKLFPRFVLEENAKDSLILVLGLSFIAVIVSQTSIGIKAIFNRNKRSVISGGS